jgi:hypothetical protein
MSLRLAALVSAVVTLLACGRSAPHGTPPTPTTKVAERLDLGTVMRRAHFAFRPSAHGFSTRDLHHELDADGRTFGFTAIGAGRRSQPFAFVPSLHRGAVRIDDGAPRTVVDNDGALRSMRGDVVERLRSDERGIEATWTLPARPRGDGELVVELALSIAPNARSTTGAHALDTTTGLGVRIGDATWIDATGARVTMPIEIDGDRAFYRVAASTIEQAAYPVVIDPVISAEFGMDAPVEGPAPESQERASVACGTSNCLIVWSDNRRGDRADVFGARVSSAGTILDPLGLAIATSTDDETHPQIAWNGTHYFVTWAVSPGRAGPPFSSLGATRIDSAGTVDPAPVSIAISSSMAPALTCGSGQCLVATVDPTASVKYTRISAAGAVLDVPMKTAATGSRETGRPLTAAQIGGTFMLVFGDTSNHVRTVRVDSAGAILDTTPGTPIGGTSLQYAPAIAPAGTSYLLVWQDDRGGVQDLYGARLTTAGASIDGVGFAIRKSADLETNPEVTFNGTDWVVAWTEGPPRTAIALSRAARVTAAGKLLDTTPIVVTTDSLVPSTVLASDGTQTFAVFSAAGLDVSGFDVFLQRIDNGGKLSGAKTVVARSANVQQAPRVAYGNGGNSLVVWEDRRTNMDIYAVRVDASGAVLDPTGIAVVGLVAQEKHPDVAFDGTNWLVIWNDSRGITTAGSVYGARVSATGAVLDAPSMPLAGDLYYDGMPVAGFDGTNYLIAFRANSGGVRAIRVDKSARPVDSGSILLMSGTREATGIAFDGTNYLVVASDSSSGSTSGDVFGARVSNALVPLGAQFAISAALFRQGEARVAFGGGQYLVVWNDTRNGVGDDIYGTRIATDGTIRDPAGLPIAIGVGDQTTPDVAHDGGDFFVVWAHQVAGLSDIHGAFVAPTGAVRGPTPLVIAAHAELELNPRVAAVSKTRRMVTYSRFDLDAAYRSLRARARYVDGLPSGTTCTSATECVSGACVDGFCCESACTGQCAACDVAGNEGFCIAVAGTPHGTRAACGGTAGTCAARCDGIDSAKCTFPGTTTTCSTSACLGGIETHESTCNSTGACSDMPKSCGAFACGPMSCRTTCASAAECAAGFACKDGTCIPALTLGEACTTSAACSAGLFCTDGVCCGLASCGAGQSCAAGKGKCVKLKGSACTIGAECETASCVDGVCCDSACGGQCEACDVDGNKGTCLAISGAPHGSRMACDLGTEECAARSCDGKDATKCGGYAHATTKQCKAPRCEGEKFFAAATCTGGGACGEQIETSCLPYTCEASGCRTTCAAAEHCASGFACKSGVCEPTGTKCSDDGTTMLAANGESTSCAPYLCRAGACIGRCESTADCTGDNVCDANGQCGPRPPRTEVEDGGGCTYGSRSDGGAWLSLLGALALLSRDRRRSRPRARSLVRAKRTSRR